jgi:hypothetical protein
MLSYLDANLKKPVSRPNVKRTRKNPKYAYISVIMPYSSGKKTLVYRGTRK